MNKIKMAPSDNVQVTSGELQRARREAKPGEPLVYNLGPNRRERRADMKALQYKLDHNGKDDERGLANNRGNAGKKVYDKMAYFFLRLGERRHAREL